MVMMQSATLGIELFGHVANVTMAQEKQNIQCTIMRRDMYSLHTPGDTQGRLQLQAR